MSAIGDVWNDLEASSPHFVDLLVAVAVLIGGVIVQRVVARTLRGAYWRRVDRAAAARGIEELTRMKRQKTLVTLLESLVRYGVYGAALVIAIGIVTGGRATGVFSASLIVVLVGFGLQRLLGDVVAGALLLFEGHFAVGDVITVHGHDVTGTVEEFSLRTTALRTLGGDRIVVMNGGISTFTRWSYGQREYRIELLASGAGAIEQVADVFAREDIGVDGLWVRPPRVARSAMRDGDVAWIVGSAVVAPAQEVLVTRLVALLEVELGDRLVGPVTALPLYQPDFEAWRTGLLVRD